MARMTRRWARATRVANTVVAGARGTFDLLADYKIEKGVTELVATIGAIIVDVGVLPGGLEAAGSLDNWAFGIDVLPKGQGVDASPQVGTDSWPWMWYWDLLEFPHAWEMAAGDFRITPIVKSIHIRAMRKMKFNEDLTLRVRNNTGDSAVFLLGGNILLLEG